MVNLSSPWQHALFHIFTNTMLRLCLVPITLFLPLSCSAAASKHGHNELHDLVRSSCAYASYSFVCLAILPKWLWRSAFLVKAKCPPTCRKSRPRSTKGRIRTSESNLHWVIGSSRFPTPSEDLSKTLNELKHLIDDTFSWQMSNAHMLVSSVLTNEDTCLDGFRDVDSKVNNDVKRKIQQCG